MQKLKDLYKRNIEDWKPIRELYTDAGYKMTAIRGALSSHVADEDLELDCSEYACGYLKAIMNICGLLNELVLEENEELYRKETENGCQEHNN